MRYDPSIRPRRSCRLRGYDYSQEGAYYVTICTRNKKCLFGSIIDREMHLNAAGEMVRSVWEELPMRFPNIELGDFVVMPNHLHAVVVITRPDAVSEEPFMDAYDRADGTLCGSVGRILQAYKSITTDEYIHGVRHHGWVPFNRKLWHRNYWDHIIRDAQDYIRILEYIDDNPARWQTHST